MSAVQKFIELPTELIFNVLLALNDENLANVCQTNKRATNMCKDDSFWNKRIRHIFNYKLAKYKGKNSTYREMYDFFRRYNISRRYNTQTSFEVLLIHAADLGHLGIVKYLVEEKEADINYQKERALDNASFNGHLFVVKYLVAKGANIHSESENPLIYASYNGKLSVVRFLVTKGANIHARHDGALVQASARGHLPVIKYLLVKGANINAQDILTKAAFPRGLLVVKYLIEHGAEIHPETFENIKKLSIIHKEYLELAQYLEKYLERNL